MSISDLSKNQIIDLIETAITFKAAAKQSVGQPNLKLQNKTLAMIFDKASLRTRLSFEIAMTQFGGHAVYLAADDIKLGVRETVHDSAIVISSMADCIVARVSSHAAVLELAEYSSVPVVNAMTDREHPCQVLADVMTIYERFGSFDNLKLVYVGDANNNVTNSLILAAKILGLEMSIASPSGYEAASTIVAQNPDLKRYSDPRQAVKDAHIVVTDTWVSMGKEAEVAKRLTALAPYQVTPALMGLAHPDAIFMHCLPAYRGKEVTASVIDGPQSVVFAEAENRLYAQEAVLMNLLAGAV